jgi:YfiR/HmsC-like
MTLFNFMKSKKIIALIFCALPFLSKAQTDTVSNVNKLPEPSPEELANLKAVCMYNFTRYIEWSIEQSENEFVIGIIGPSAIDKPISEIARTNTVNNRKIVIKHFSKPEDISYCHMLFIPRSCPVPLQSILDRAGKGVLVVSEEPGFARQGAAFNFIPVHDKLKFEANLKAINAAGVKVSSQLLRLAIVINQ